MTEIFSATEKLVDLILSFRLLASSEAVVRPSARRSANFRVSSSPYHRSLRIQLGMWVVVFSRNEVVWTLQIISWRKYILKVNRLIPNVPRKR